MQRRLVFLPRREVLENPAQFQVPFQEVNIPVATGTGAVEQIHGWWIPHAPVSPNTLLYLHGNGINIGANTKHALRLRDMGFNVLIIDYRGYGQSQGAFPSEASVYADAEATWQYLLHQRQLSPSRPITPDHLFIYGHSLGGAVAIELVSHHPEVAGLIVDSSFTSVLDVAADYPGSRYFPLPLLLNQRFDSIQKIKQITVPTLFIHGTADQTIPYFMSEALYAAKPGAKQLVLISGANHNNGATTDLQSYTQGVLSLVKTAQSQAGQRSKLHARNAGT